MKIKEAAEALKSIGWRNYMGDGDRYALFRLPDRIIQLFYVIRRATDYQQLGIDFSTSTDEFSAVYNHIDNQQHRYSPLIFARKGGDIRDSGMIREEHVHQASQQAIDWAKCQDLHQALLDHAALPTKSPGTRPLLHLTSLALLSDVDKLKSYQTSFAAGDRLGFVPYITKDYIDRAVALAEQHANNPTP